jgi:NADH-quinone oxidoreductase subunit K
MIGLGHFLVVSAILFVLGVFGIFLNRKNVIVILMAIELILLAVNINLVAFSAYLGDMVGQVFAMFVLTVAAGEAAIGLAILVIYFRGRGTIAVDDIKHMNLFVMPAKAGISELERAAGLAEAPAFAGVTA